MKLLYLSVALCLVCGTAEAKPRRNYQSGQPMQNAVRAVTNTAQGVAEACARMGRLSHMGGNGSMMEGIGMGSTPEAALANCCYSRSGWPVVDQGVARGANGQYFACQRYVAR